MYAVGSTNLTDEAQPASVKAIHKHHDLVLYKIQEFTLKNPAIQ